MFFYDQLYVFADVPGYRVDFCLIRIFEAKSPFNLVLLMAVIIRALLSSGFSLWQVK